MLVQASDDCDERGGALDSLRVLMFDGHLLGQGRAKDARRRPLIVANPPSDAEFRRLIERLLVAGADSPHDLQATLRTRYPEAVVRPRELADEVFEVWYVYRDGHWIRSAEHA